MLVTKPSKDPEERASYRIISLLNAYAKLIVKILALHLSTVIEDLIHVDQNRFMSRKGTDINIRRLFFNLATGHANSGTRVVACLDAEKVFDSVEWVFLWEVLHRYDFGPQYTQ